MVYRDKGHFCFGCSVEGVVVEVSCEGLGFSGFRVRAFYRVAVFTGMLQSPVWIHRRIL